jgi:hypothetical protein
MITYVAIEEGERVGNLPTRLEVLRKLARNDHPISRLIVKVAELKLSDADLAKILVEETGDDLADVNCSINFARHCQKTGNHCSI